MASRNYWRSNGFPKILRSSGTSLRVGPNSFFSWARDGKPKNRVPRPSVAWTGLFVRPITISTVTPATPKPIHSQNLSRFRWLVHGFSTREGGFSTAYSKDSQDGNRVPRPSSAGAESFVRDLNLGFTPEDRPATVRKNRDAFMLALGASSGAAIRIPAIQP